jgi:hypothetical protein
MMSRSLIELAKQNTPEAHAELVLGIADAILKDIGSRSDDELRLFAEIALLLYATLPAEDRAQLARRLASHERAPVGLAMKLAEDELEVARPMLTHGGCFNQDHLLDLARRVSEKHLEFIAKRRDIGHEVSDTLVERGTKSIRRILASNRDIRLSRLALQTLVSQSINDAVLREDLALRQDLSRGQREQILPLINEATQAKLRDIISGALSEEKLDQFARFKQIRRELGPALDTADMRKLRKLAQDFSIDLNDLVILLLQDNRLAQVIELMAQLTRKIPADLRNAIYKGATDLVVEVALTLKFRPDTFALLAHARCKQLRYPDSQANDWITIYTEALLGLQGFPDPAPTGFAAKRKRRERTRGMRGDPARAKRLAAI